jgi:hypothetical protein
VAYGTYNEYIIFPILDFIKREIEKLNRQRQNVVLDNGVLPAIDSQINRYQEMLKRLESPEYHLDLQRNDTVNSDILTDIIIDYGQELQLLVKLFRVEGKLTHIISSVMVQEIGQTGYYSNPYNMGFNDFGQYLKYLVEIKHYNDLLSLGGGVSVEVSNRIVELFQLKEDLEKKYGLSSFDLLSLEDLMKYYPVDLVVEPIAGSSLVLVGFDEKESEEKENKYILLLKVQVDLHYIENRLEGVSSKIISGAV